MKILKVTMYMYVDEDLVEDAKKWEHHIESLVDLDSYPDIEAIYDVTVEEVQL